VLGIGDINWCVVLSAVTSTSVPMRSTIEGIGATHTGIHTLRKRAS